MTMAVQAMPRMHRTRATADRIRGRRVLDVGAGGCALGTLTDGPYVATDIDLPSEAPGFPIARAAVEALPFRDEAFDTVACISVLQYVLDVEGALTELRRVTKAGGQAIVLVPNIAYVRNRLKLAMGRFPWSSTTDSWRAGTIRYFALRDVKPLVERVGFRLVAVGCSGRLRGLRSRWPSLLGADLLLDLERR